MYLTFVCFKDVLRDTLNPFYHSFYTTASLWCHREGNPAHLFLKTAAFQKQEELKQLVLDRGWNEGLPRGPVLNKEGLLWSESCKATLVEFKVKHKELEMSNSPNISAHLCVNL